MANVVLCHGRLTEGAAVSASSAASDSLAAANAITRQPSERLRFTGCTSEWVQVVLTASQAIDCIAVIGNFSLYAEIDILAADAAVDLPGSPDWSALGLEDPARPGSGPSGTLPARERVIRAHLPPTAEDRLAWRIVVRDPDNPAGYVEINRVILGRKWQPGRNFTYGREIGLIDDAQTERTMGGASRTTERGLLRSMGFTLPVADEDEMLATGLALDALVGARHPLLVLSNPEATTHFQALSLYGLMAQLSPAQNVAHGLWSKRYQLTEMV